MTNKTKWLIAVPFAAFVALVIPAAIAGNPLWFINRWTDALYVSLSAGMWLIATAFVDVDRPRGSPDLANGLIPLGLILSVPISVLDRVHWIASTLPPVVELLGILISSSAVFLGLISRQYLGRSYLPRSGRSTDSRLVREGPYRWIRHPLYLATILWVVGWPLIIASLLGSFSAVIFVLPAIRRRMTTEEEELLRAYGEEYAEYQERTWRLVPHVY